jgi:hypothetical protein
MRNHDIDKLEEALRETHRNIEVPSASHEWQTNLMRRILQITTREETIENTWPAFTRLAWRFSLVSSVVVIILTVIVLQSDLLPAREIAMMMLEDPASLLFSQPFAI